MTTFLVTIGIGLSTAAILSLSAVAFTLEYAVSRIANFAHGEFLTLGAFAAYSGQRIFHQNVAAAAVIAALAGAVAGLALNFGLIEQFRGRTAITVFIATLGVALIVENLLVIIYGAANVTYSFPQGNLHHVGPFLWTTSDIEVIISALAVAGLIYLLLQHTRFGKAVRAISQDRALAQVSGIPARRIIMQTWALAGAIAGFAGVRAGLYGRHLRPHPRLQLSAAHHHGHRGRGPRPALRDLRRRHHRRARDPDRRYLHQFGL